MTRTRIGISVLGLTPLLSGGIGLYARHLVASLAHAAPREAEFILFCNASNSDSFAATVADRPHWTVKTVGVAARPQGIRAIAEQGLLPSLVRRFGLDLLHSPSYTWPLASRCRGVVTVCDMLYAVLPSAVPLAKRVFWKLAVPLSVRRCQRTVTISVNAKGDITRFLGVDPDKICVTYLAGAVTEPAGGLSESAIREGVAKYGCTSGRYLLSVGAVGRHKNLSTTIEALGFVRRAAALRDVRLVATGLDYGTRRESLGLVERLGLGDSVTLPGYVNDDELAALYAGAGAYVSTSFMEGFGMTAVEAMSFGTPVVVGNRAALPEIVGDGGVVVDAANPVEVCDAVRSILEDPNRSRELSEAARRRSRRFSWSDTAKSTWAAYQAALSED